MNNFIREIISLLRGIEKNIGGGGGGGSIPETQMALIAKQGSDATATISDISQELGKLGTPAEGQPNTLFAAIAQGGGASVDDIVSALLRQTNFPMTFDGIQFEEGYNCSTFLEAYSNVSHIRSITDNYHTNEFTEITSPIIYFNRVAVGTGRFYGNSWIKELYYPILTGGEGWWSWNSNPKLEILSLPKLKDFSEFSNRPRLGNCPKLIDVTFGAYANGNIYITSAWSPTEALGSDTKSLVRAGETFESNSDKLLYNIREHIAKNLPDRSAETTKYTIKFHADMYAIFDDATKLAFTSRGWNVSA